MPPERSFLASTHDDEPGLDQTYYFFRGRGISQLIGSSELLIVVVNACVLGLFTGGLVVGLGGQMGWAIAAGAAVAVLHVAVSVSYGVRGYVRAWRDFQPLHPSDEPPPIWRTGARRQPE